MNDNVQQLFTVDVYISAAAIRKISHCFQCLFHNNTPVWFNATGKLPLS